ncbi:uncharacterized protein LOC113871764 [Abrus precatorius]|uniref:Uncharacterized protein LOC113871764 n=1 Tax=Abrus precatorius TaxID=3816 RepID=A0A8B8M9K0_ABRPR|nr:uncharacterized protein LOC113871764 [Abrus precatorius]
MDFVDGLLRSDRHTSIMVVVDRLSKFAHLIPLTHPYSARLVASKFMEYVRWLIDALNNIRDVLFIIDQSSGALFFFGQNTDITPRFIHLLVWHLSKPCTHILTYETGSTMVDELDAQLAACDELLSELKQHLATSNNRMKQLVDSKWRDINFNNNDCVFLHLQPYRQQSVFRWTSQKLSNRFFDPFQVEERIGQAAYKLKLPAALRIHHVFHAFLLKKRIGTDPPIKGKLPPLRENISLQLEPEKVLEIQWMKQGSKFKSELLVQWKGLSIEEATWEDEE